MVVQIQMHVIIILMQIWMMVLVLDHIYVMMELLLNVI